MRIKKYLAKSMREALIQIKEELGEDAIILKTRKLPKKVFALGGQEEIEVTAAVDEDSQSVKPQTFQPLKISTTGVYNRPRSSNVIDIDQTDILDIKPWKPPFLDQTLKTKIKAETKGEVEAVQVKKDSENEKEISELKHNVDELKNLVKNIIEKGNNTPSNGFTGGWAALYNKLIESEIKSEIANKIIKNLSNSDIMVSDSQIEKKFVTSLTELFPVAGPLKLKKNSPVVVVFVGPTGSGKTTTLAKLAAHCCINKHKKISIITADTYRIAAIEQIKMFADIIKVGLQVVFSPSEVPDALRECEKDDIVFVDTAGRSQRNTEHMRDLQVLLSELHPDEIHLVLSATTKDSDLSDIIKRYKDVNVNRIVFTKIDETVKVGNIFNLISESKIPVSYFTFGQSVPDDIELAQTTKFVQRLWEGTGA